MTDQRECSTCKEVKPLDLFRKPTPSGRIYRQCKACNHEKTMEWRRANREKHRENTRRDYEKHPHRYRAQSAKYRAARRNAVPSSLPDTMLKEIQLFYQIAQWYEEDVHVDHIVPLAAENVCGLHVPWNLQIISAQENWQKYNKME